MLDLGCGDGHIAVLLASRGYFVTGVDLPGGVPPGLPPAVELITADLDQGLPQLSCRYQYVLCADILEHLRRPEEILQQVRSQLLPEGRLVASLPNSGNIYFRLNVLIGRFPSHPRGLFDRTHLHFYTWAGWRGLFRESGFEILTVKPSVIPVGLALPRWKDTAAVRLAEWICFGLARMWKKLFAYQFVVVARPLESE